MKIEIDLSSLNLLGVSSINIVPDTMTVTGFTKKSPFDEVSFTIPTDKDNEYFKMTK